MKKSLIALAVAGAFAAPAFAATENVDVYGVLNVDVNYVNDDNAGTDSQIGVSSNASRIGFKGAEDLGGGLNAIWQVETGFNADETSGTVGSRNTFVGLKGGFGTILAGKHDTPMKLLGRKVDNFGDIMADSRNLLGSSATSGTSMFDLRTNNTIAYVSPTIAGGLTLIGAYVTDHQKAGTSPTCGDGLDCNVNDAYSFSADYTNGPLMLGAGYENQNVGTGVADNNISRDMWRLVAGYTFGNFKIAGLYESGSADAGLDTAERDGFGVFANYAMGNITLKANYLSVGEYGNTNNTGAEQWTVGADYALSKRTTAYAYYVAIDNEAGAAFDLGSAQGVSDFTQTNAGSDPSAFGIGMKHSF